MKRKQADPCIQRNQPSLQCPRLHTGIGKSKTVGTGRYQYCIKQPCFKDRHYPSPMVPTPDLGLDGQSYCILTDKVRLTDWRFVLPGVGTYGNNLSTMKVIRTSTITKITSNRSHILAVVMSSRMALPSVSLNLSFIQY